MNEQILTDKQSSIEVSRNAKGEYSWKIKVYYNDDKKSEIQVIDQIAQANEAMKNTFRK